MIKKKLWKITGWYANSVDEPENKSKIKAFETFTSDKNFSDQKFISNYVSYYRSGKTSSKVFYDREGILSGEANYWYESGQLKQHFVYVDGKIHGTFISYNSNGTVESKVSLSTVNTPMGRVITMMKTVIQRVNTAI